MDVPSKVLTIFLGQRGEVSHDVFHQCVGVAGLTFGFHLSSFKPGNVEDAGNEIQQSYSTSMNGFQ